MDTLDDNLQRLIKALEVLSSRDTADREALDDCLDQLFQQKIDLAGTARHKDQPPYRQAVQQLAAAAQKAERAAKNPTDAKGLIPIVEAAIGRVGRLLDLIAPID